MNKIFLILALGISSTLLWSDKFVYDCYLEDRGVKKDKFITVTGNTKDMFREGTKFYLNTLEMTVTRNKGGTVVFSELKWKDNGKNALSADIYQSLSQVIVGDHDRDGKLKKTRRYECKFSFSSD